MKKKRYSSFRIWALDNIEVWDKSVLCMGNSIMTACDYSILFPPMLSRCGDTYKIRMRKWNPGNYI